MEEREKSNKQTMIIVAVLCAMLFGLAVAYAALSATLNITYATLTQNALSWNVGFETGTINGTKTGSSSTSCGVATATASTVSLDSTVLATVGDKCVYKLKVKNTGTVGAILSSIAAKTPSSVTCNTGTTSQMVCENITYKLTADQAGSTLLGVNNVLAPTSGSLDVYLIAEYTGTSTGSSSQQTGAGFTLNYSQH
ncbi:MAG: hypothetical protein IKE63_03505 [Bacilli bacterium]|nr:hypothetical protein [Bacilli bacterium]